MWGDPHIKTLDGIEYTFNPRGYVHLIRSDSFSLQARTDLAKVTNGSNAKATVYIGFAAYKRNLGRVEIYMNDAKSG